MNEKMPVRLRKEPLIEAVWELRFASDRSSVADLLPGLIYNSLRDQYPEIVRLPAADIPGAVAEQDPGLRYVPKIRIQSDHKAVLLGDRMIALSVRRPYPGWPVFSADIRTLIDAIKGTGLTLALERSSLKYVDVIDVGETPNFNWLNMRVQMAQHEIDTHPMQLRAEIRDGELVHFVQALSPAEVSIPGDEEIIHGVLVEVDSIKPMGEGESWSAVEDQLDLLHAAAKKMFFSLLTSETLNALEPVYEE